MVCVDHDDTGKPIRMRKSKNRRTNEEPATTTPPMTGSNQVNAGKRKKNRKTRVSESADDQICSKKSKNDNNTEKQSKKDHCLPDPSTENVKPTDGVEVKRKKKKTVTSDAPAPLGNKEEPLKRKAPDSAEEELDAADKLVNSVHTNDAPVKLRKKKKSYTKLSEEAKENEETPIIAEKERLGKKKMAKSKGTVADSADLKSSLADVDSNESCNDTNVKKKSKKRKLKATETSDDTLHESIPKKKKKKSKHAEPDTNSTTTEEPVSCNVESGVDVAINKVKEKKKKSKKKKRDKDHLAGVPADATGADGDGLGQWQTAELSSVAQEKFARLLGARKSRKTASPLINLKDGESVLSKLSGVWKPPPERTMFWSALSGGKKQFSSMAMDRDETAKLNQSLETQYTKTLEFNLQKRKEGNKAKGLGFQEDPAKGKKHYIDVNKVNSVALD